MSRPLPAHLTGSRRAVPTHPTDRQRALLSALLEQDERWVLRGDWRGYLGDSVDLRDGGAVADLTRDHRIAARSWLRQQRHRLYQVIGDAPPAPDGWIEARPLYRALTP